MLATFNFLMIAIDSPVVEIMALFILKIYLNVF